MNADVRYEPNGEYVVRTIEDETLIVPIKHHRDDLDSIFRLNEAGTLVWNGIAEGLDIGEIVALLMDKYEVQKKTAAADVAGFLNLLEERGLIRVWGSQA